MKRLLMAVCVFLSGCGGGGGGGSDNSTGQTSSANISGSWAGTYNVTSNYNSTPILRGIAAKLQNNGTSLTGSFITDSNINGKVTGNISGNNISFALTSTTASCPGTYYGNGTINSSTISYTYSGSDCVGTYSNMTGQFDKLEETGTVAWSGNWWGILGVDHYTLITLKTLDSINYTGSVKIINSIDGSILTADLTGVYGWGNHADASDSTPHYSWMEFSFTNIQGKLYKSQQSTILSIHSSMGDYNASSIGIGSFDFEEKGGASTLTGAWFNQIL